ncbi:hypothetical protein EK21DRAFT_103504 [Setomelanomma holmii]|uniref:DUF7703 domain-containing protein n=1 Tax=Setomelanomma holmii TaxID=210430 RepID=A0A9P4H0K8_9PLEO|nr:hypothetical protein EK21DRAFT_103504 [Setomelanomma holmii]
MANSHAGNWIIGGNFEVNGVERTIPRAMTAFTAIAWYNSIEVLVLIFFVFKKYSGLYLWSLLTNAQNDVTDNHRIYNSLLTLGWVFMVPGQSMILYSRLHLISPNLKLLRFIFWMTIISAVVLCPPTSTLNLRQYTKHPAAYTRGYVVMEKIQMTAFTVQEVFISCVYLWETRKVMLVIFDGKARKWMWQLVPMNFLLLLLDVALLVMDFKLKIEFAVLSQIVRVLQARSQPSTSAFAITRDLEQQRLGPKAVASLVSEVEVAQANVPEEWRLEKKELDSVSPVPLSLERRGADSAGNSFMSVEQMYPGRLA